VVEENLRSYDFQMKRVQLEELPIPGTLLLVDESQDMDGCQVDWAATQAKLGKHVYLVGDAAQTIYGFRGAKSQYLMTLQVDNDCLLTSCWRFGANIARAANCVLFSKENSGQTEKDANGQYKTWFPYRIETGAPKTDIVTGASLLPRWRELGKLTLIAYANTTLMVSVLGLFRPLADNEKDIDKDEGSAEGNGIEPNKELVGNEDERPADGDDTDDEYDPADENNVDEEAPPSDNQDFPDHFPKIHINSGSASGIKTWKQIMNQVGEVYNLFQLSKQGRGASLSRKLFPEFKGRHLTWESFRSDVEGTELSKYGATIDFVEKFGHGTLQAMEVFRINVVERRFTAEEANIVLTTCHCAKGMEWNNVELCDDFVDLCIYKRKFVSYKEKRPRYLPWNFGVKSWGDDLNVLYVACTRAKEQLSVPNCSILNVWEDFDYLHQWHTASQHEMSGGLELRGIEEGVLAKDEAMELYNDLVGPLRAEYGLKLGQQLMHDVGGDHEKVVIVTRTDPTARLVTPEKPSCSRSAQRFKIT
jgi:hypothetical protein